MAKPEIYRNSSHMCPGYGAVINGNFVTIEPRPDGSFHASVMAWHLDHPTPRQKFPTLEQAVAWAAETAQNHRGSPNPRLGYDTWEIMDGCSLAPRRLESGMYRCNWRPMRVNCEHCPYLMIPEEFPTLDEAMAECRNQAQQWLDAERRQALSLAAVRAALEALAVPQHISPNSLSKPA